METSDDYVEIYRGRDGFRWRRVSANHQIVSESGEAFTRHTYALESATSLNPTLTIVDTDNNQLHPEEPNMPPVLLGGPVTFECPNCDSSVTLPQLPDKPVLHPCRGLKGLMAPMIRAGVKAKVEAVDRDDYIGRDIPQRDGEGHVVAAIVTTRDDGTDCAVLVPTAVIGREEIH